MKLCDFPHLIVFLLCIFASPIWLFYVRRYGMAIEMNREIKRTVFQTICKQ